MPCLSQLTSMFPTVLAGLVASLVCTSSWQQNSSGFLPRMSCHCITYHASDRRYTVMQTNTLYMMTTLKQYCTNLTCKSCNNIYLGFSGFLVRWLQRLLVYFLFQFLPWSRCFYLQKTTLYLFEEEKFASFQQHTILSPFFIQNIQYFSRKERLINMG